MEDPGRDRRGAGGGPGPGPAGIKGAQYRSHEPAVERQEMLLGELEYVHYLID